MSEGVGLVNLGPISALLGDLETARAQLVGAREIHVLIGAQRPESYALHRLGTVEEQEGHVEEAERLYTEALALRREIKFSIGVAETLVALGRLKWATGRPDEAKRDLEEAGDLSHRLDIPDCAVLADACLAVAGGDIEKALASLDRYESRLGVFTRMEVRLVLWKATQDPSHLEEAYRMLCFVRDHAPEEYRDSMIENVPLHRRIMEAKQS
ncbi:MAG: tetratricopeptide repeat protein [Planctomycetota bacterium]